MQSIPWRLLCNIMRELFKTVASLVRWSEKDISVYNLKGVIVKKNLVVAIVI